MVFLGSFLFCAEQLVIMAKMSVPGLILVLPKGFDKKSIEELEMIDFHIVVGKSTPANPLFFSNPRLREALLKHPHLEGKSIGYMEYSLDAFTKSAPVLKVTNYPFFYLGKELVDFKGKNFALELQQKANSAVMHRFGKVIIKPFSSVSKDREKQLASLKIKLDSARSYSIPVKSMVDKINEKLRLNRKRFRLKK